MSTGIVEEMREYAVVYEKTSTGWSAYAPNVPGLGVAGETFEATETLIRDGLQFHLEATLEDGLELPESTTRVAMVRVAL